MSFTTHQIIRELEREIKMRERVFPRLVREEKLTTAEAVKRINIIKQILADYRDKLPKQESLF